MEIGYVFKDGTFKSLNCLGLKQGSKFEFVLIAEGYAVALHAMGMTYPQKDTMRPNDKRSVEFSVDFAADEGPDAYRCRLTKHGALACLVGGYSAAEFKQMNVDTGQVYEVTEVN